MYPILVGESAKDILSSAADLATVVAAVFAIVAVNAWSKSEKHKALLELMSLDNSFSALYLHIEKVHSVGGAKWRGDELSIANAQVEESRKAFFAASSEYSQVLRRASIYMSKPEINSFKWTYEKLQELYMDYTVKIGLKVEACIPGRGRLEVLQLLEEFSSFRAELEETKKLARADIDALIRSSI